MKIQEVSAISKLFLAVVNALRTLQERVGNLENEKHAAKEKISDLERELSTTRKLLFHQQQQYATGPFNGQNKPNYEEFKSPSMYIQPNEPPRPSSPYHVMDPTLEKDIFARISPSGTRIYHEKGSSPVHQNPIYSPLFKSSPEKPKNSQVFVTSTSPSPNQPSNNKYAENFEDNITIELFEDNEQKRTMQRISEAQEKVAKLQKRVNEVRETQEIHLKESQRPHSAGKIYSLPDPDFNTGKISNTNKFDDLERAIPSPTNKNYAIPEIEIKNYNILDETATSQFNHGSKNQESVLIEREIMTDRMLLKQKLAGKKQQKKKEDETPSIPTWDKIGGRKSKKAHVKVKSKPLLRSEPYSSEDSVGRQMPFIVGQV